MPAPARLDQLHAHLEREPPAPVYLIAGQEPLLLLEAADAVRAAARRHGYEEREVLEAGESGFDWARLAASTQQGSLFGGGRKLVDVRLPTGKPGKDGAQALSACGEQPAADTIVLLTCTDWSKKHGDTAWVSAFSAPGWYLPIWPLRREELPRWIAARARTRGLQLEPSAIDLLAERTEGNLLACAQELDKLVLLGQAGPIAAEQLATILAEQARRDVFALSDAMLVGDGVRALRILRGLRAEGEAIVPVLSWLGGQVELLARAAEAQARDGSADRALRAERVWDSRLPMYRSALQRIGARGCARALVTFARLDRIAKGREWPAGDVWLEAERLVLKLSGGARRRAA